MISTTQTCNKCHERLSEVKCGKKNCSTIHFKCLHCNDIDSRIFVLDSENGEMCLYCPFCGKETLYSSASKKDVYACSEGCTPFIMNELIR